MCFVTPSPTGQSCKIIYICSQLLGLNLVLLCSGYSHSSCFQIDLCTKMCIYPCLFEGSLRTVFYKCLMIYFCVVCSVPVLQVVAHRVREASTAGSTFEMTCQVTGQHLRNPGYTVLIRFEETLGGKSRKVLSLSQDSVLQSEEWSEPSRIDSVVLEKTGQLEYRFRLYGAQDADTGFYYCDVKAWTRDQKQEWIKAVSAESNKIEIAFVHTGITMLTRLQIQ